MRLIKCFFMIFATAFVFGQYAPLAGATTRQLRECTDPAYDMTDCERAIRVQQRKRDQEKLPDTKRQMIAGFNEDVLVEHATGYRMGLHKMRIQGSKDSVTGIRFGIPGHWKMFVLGDADGCELGNYVEVVKNTPEFTFFQWTCAFTWPTSRRRDTHFHYLNFDKRFERLDAIVQGVSRQHTDPSLTLAKGTYKFRWVYKNDGDKPFNVFYDFRITGKRPQDIKCLRSWNDECDIALRDGPLKPSEYKIVE